MAVLSAKSRKGMAQAKFGLSGKRFPMNDKVHDRMAISGATRSERAGNISPAQAAKVKSEARAKLGIRKPTSEGRELERRLAAKDRR
jgi:hypothetical protein